jgi:hypothetical protein
MIRKKNQQSLQCRAKTLGFDEDREGVAGSERKWEEILLHLLFLFLAIYRFFMV